MLVVNQTSEYAGERVGGGEPQCLRGDSLKRDVEQDHEQWWSVMKEERGRERRE